jgi:hypothetical protein
MTTPMLRLLPALNTLTQVKRKYADDSF